MARSSTCAPTAVSSIAPDEAVGCWEIRGFSYFNSNKGMRYNSRWLCEAGKARFAFVFYPGGHHEQPEQLEKTSSIYVLVGCLFNVWVSYKIAVIGKAGETTYATEDKFLMDKDHRQLGDDCPRASTSKLRGFPCFLKYKVLHEIAKQQDDALQLKLEIKAWPEIPVVQDVGCMPVPISLPSGALAKDLGILLREGTAADVTLEVSSGSHGHATEKFRAHRLLLAARSPVFKQMFFSSSMAEAAAAAEVKVVDSDPKVVKWFLNFLYTDSIPEEISGDDEALCHLLAVAHKYQVQPLLEYCEAGIVSRLSEDNVCERLMMADLLEMSSLRSHILHYVGFSRARMAEVQASDSFARLAKQRPQLLVEILAQAVAPAPKRAAAVPELPEDLNSLSVAKLKQLLGDRGLPVCGNKASLLERLQSSVSSR